MGYGVLRQDLSGAPRDAGVLTCPVLHRRKRQESGLPLGCKLRTPPAEAFAMRTARYLTAALLCLAAIPAWAGTQDDAVVALHAPPIHVGGDPCGVVLEAPFFVACSDYVVHHDALEAWHAWLVVARADSGAGVSELSCGISSSGDTPPFVVWFPCADAESPSGAWPDSGSGNRITWNSSTNCQRETIAGDGVYAEAGAFYIYAYGDGSFAMTPNEAEGETAIVVTDCSGASSELSAPGGRIGFGNVEGYNPCADDVPVTQKTWGRIKQHYTY